LSNELLFFRGMSLNGNRLLVNQANQSNFLLPRGKRPWWFMKYTHLKDY